MNASDATASPLVSVIIVNYNCKKWLDRFFPSLRAQTIFDRAEFVIVDNTSTDGSAEICQKEMASWPNGVFLPTGGNYGFGGGSNRGAAIARGKYFLFLNPDVRLEPDCLEELVTKAETIPTKAASPLVLDYDSNDIQAQGAVGFDMFGCMVSPGATVMQSLPFAGGTFPFTRRELFEQIGGFDEEFFLFNEEMDLCWRIWLSGESISQIVSAKIHHQGASSGEGGAKNRTSEMKRFYANRNQLLTILKDANCLLLLLAITQSTLLMFEGLAGSVLARRFSVLRWSFLKPISDCWRLRKHVAAERRRIKKFRRRGDLWIFRRFFRFTIGRWVDVKRLFKFGATIDKAV